MLYNKHTFTNEKLCYNALTLITLLQICTTAGGGLSTKKIAAARDPRLRSSPAAPCEPAELAPGGVGEVLVELLGEVPGEVLACHLAVADAASDGQRAPPRV